MAAVGDFPNMNQVMLDLLRIEMLTGPTYMKWRVLGGENQVEICLHIVFTVLYQQLQEVQILNARSMGQMIDRTISGVLRTETLMDLIYMRWRE